MEIMIYKIYDITGKMATDSESGQAVHDIILPYLQKGQAVDLDFTGVEIFATLFFNCAIGQLLANVPIEEIRTLLHTHGLSKDGQSIMEKAINYAARYYSDEKYRKAVDQVFEEEYAASF
jgi:STAS-like domain of unknown function (DUF4325)